MSDDEDYVVEEPVLAEDDPLKAFLPTSFGKQSKEADIDAQIERTRRPAWKPPKEETGDKKGGKDDDSSSDSDSDSDDDDDDDYLDKFPLSHELVFKTHEKAVTSITLDPSGSRMATGSRDGTIKFYDFASMTPNTLRAFKSVDPWDPDSHPINHIAFQPLGGGALMCVTAHPQVKILSRDGSVLTEFVKGDMYLRDMNNTKGHVGEVLTGAWHPTDRDTCVTAGSDSTLRIWDINNKRSQKEVIVFKSRAAGSAGRSRMTAVTWGQSKESSSTTPNNVLVAAALDGTLVLYGGDGPFTRPSAEVRDAHKPGTWTTGIDISPDGRMVVTRGGDGLIKMWDMRKFKQPVVTVPHESDTAGRYPMANIQYGPGGSSILTGSVTGHLHVLNPGNLRPEVVTPVTPDSPLVVVNWHSKLNQVMTGSANGSTHVLFDPARSSRGAVDIIHRAPKTRHIDDDPSLTMDQSALGLSGDAIIIPGGGMPGTKRTGVSASGKSYDPRRPHMPAPTPFSHTNPDEKHIEQNIPLSRMLHEDPREALLKYAEIAKKEPIFTGGWRGNKQVTEYAELSDEEEEPDKKKVKR